MSVLLFVMDHLAEQRALTRKLSVDLQDSSLFVALLLKYRLLKRQIVLVCRSQKDGGYIVS